MNGDIDWNTLFKGEIENCIIILPAQGLFDIMESGLEVRVCFHCIKLEAMSYPILLSYQRLYTRYSIFRYPYH